MDIVRGGADVIILGDSDIATGGAGADVFSVGDYIEEDRSAVITDFVVGQDRLELDYDPAAGPEPEVIFVEGPQDTEVFLGDVRVVTLRGVTSIDGIDLRLFERTD